VPDEVLGDSNDGAQWSSVSEMWLHGFTQLIGHMFGKKHRQCLTLKNNVVS
jgi:hypothetical protein